MKLEAVPELIQGIINENVITEEMLDRERKLFERCKNLEIVKDALSKTGDRWAPLYDAIKDDPRAQHDESLKNLVSFLQALKWIQVESIKAIDEKDYDRLAALKLLTEDIGKRIDQIVTNLMGLFAST